MGGGERIIAMKPSYARSPSLRLLARGIVILTALMTVALVLLLILTGRLYDRATATLSSFSAGLELAVTLETRVRDYDQLTRLARATNSAELEAERTAVALELLSAVETADGRLAPLRRSGALDRAKVVLERYAENPTPLARREASESIDEMRASNRSTLEDAQVALSRYRRVAAWAGFVIAGVLVGALIIMFVTTWRHAVRPILRVATALDRIGRGDEPQRLDEDVPRELQSIVHAYNDLVDRLVWQRQNELAYLASVAHDLRNPLGALRTGIAVVRRKAQPDDRLERMFALVERQVERLDRMVGDLLDMASIEAGQLVIEKEQVDLTRLAHDVVALYRPTLCSHDLVLTLPDQPVIAECDAARIEQVLGNLISNAVKYSPGGCVEVSVFTSGSEAALAVRDRGLGIPKEALDQVFAPFWRKRVDRKVGGAGLGLSVARRIVEGHGGRIEVASVEGKGSTFTVHLPMRAAAADEELRAFAA